MRSETIHIEQQGSLLKVKHEHANDTPRGGGGQRGQVTTFSSASRKRMIEMFTRMSRVKVNRKRGLFITLTYPFLMTDAKRAKRDLKVFIERVQEEFPHAYIVWRMEEQRSGSIHFHLIIGNVPYWDVKDAQDDWCEVTSTTARNSLDLKAIKTARGVMHYVSKYVAKELRPTWNRHEAKYTFMLAVMMTNIRRVVAVALMGLSMSHIFSKPEPLTGRRWGVYGRKNIPYAKKRNVTLTSTTYTYMCAVNSLQSRWARWFASFTVFDGTAHMLLGRMIKIVNNGHATFSSITNRLKRRKALLRNESNTIERTMRKAKIHKERGTLFDTFMWCQAFYRFLASGDSEEKAYSDASLAFPNG